MPSIGYGLETAGIADSKLTSLRRMINNAAGTPTGGGHFETELFAKGALVGRLDPAFDAHAKPLATWATAWWDGWRSPHQLADAFHRANDDVRRQSPRNANLWNRVKGPTAAAILTASRIGWYFSSPCHLHTDDDEVFNLTRDSPATVVKAVHAAVIRWRAANVLQLSLATAPLLQMPPFDPPEGVLPSEIGKWRRARARNE